MPGKGPGLMQARLTQNDTRLYTPDRDLAHCFGPFIERVAQRIEDGRWPALTRLANLEGIDEETLGKACQCLCHFIVTQVDTASETMAQGMDRCGWLDLPETARVIVMAHLGAITLGAHWAGVREATMGGQGPALTYKALADVGHRCAELMKKPRWKRRLERRWNAIKQAGAAIKQALKALRTG